MAEKHGKLVDVESYMNLFDNLARIDSSEKYENFLSVLAEAPISRDDALGLLLLAEQGAHRRYSQSVALLFSRMMVSAFTDEYDERELAHHANRIALLTTRREAGIRTSADLFLYGHRRLLMVLQGAGINEPHLREWMSIAFCQIAASSPQRKEALERAVLELHPGNVRIGKRYQSDIGYVRSVLIRALKQLTQQAASSRRSNELLCHNIIFLFVSVMVIITLSIWMRHLVSFPQSSLMFRGCNWLGAALIAWPLLLIVTWLFAVLEARRTHTFHFISPSHAINYRLLIVGEAMPFSRDWFFQLFQFIWLPFVLIACLLLAKYQELPRWLKTVWKPTAKNEQTFETFVNSLNPSWLPEFSTSGNIWSQARSFLSSDALALSLALIASLLFIANQIRIQRRRLRFGTNIHWWDKRISTYEWVIRLTMVGLDEFLGIILLLKIIVISLVAYELVATNAVAVSYLASDGIGGLKFLTDIFTNLSWLVFGFGFFVIATIYTHWNLLEYRKTDTALFTIYIVLLVLTMAPLVALESRLAMEHNVILTGLSVPPMGSQPDAISEMAKYIRDVMALRDWRVSAINVGVLGNPVLPLLFQFFVVAVQYLIREGKLPSLPIPGLGVRVGKGSTNGR